MTTLQNLRDDTIVPAQSSAVAPTVVDTKSNNTVIVHGVCNLCGGLHGCGQGTVNGGVLNITPPTVVEPIAVPCHVLEGKYFSSHNAKVKYHIASLLRLTGLPPDQAERVATLLGDTHVLAEITKATPITLYENNKGKKFLTLAEARTATNPGLNIIS